LQKKESIAIEYEEKMNRIVALANECAKLLGQGKVEDLGKILDEGWQFKKSLGSFISNDEVDKRYEFLLKNGAEGGRLLGAGMSGYILVLVSPEKQLAFLSACNENEIPIERVYLDIEGARVL
jgi:D-glycero-alpha-D-manno-heptose-7-phosphate kinase